MTESYKSSSTPATCTRHLHPHPPLAPATCTCVCVGGGDEGNATLPCSTLACSLALPTLTCCILRSWRERAPPRATSARL